MNWWIHLSWSHAALIILIALLIICFVCIALTTPRRGATRVRTQGWPIIDYSREYQKKVKWLGDRFLLAKPINRRPA